MSEPAAGAQEVHVGSAGTCEAFGATQFGLTIMDARDEERVYRVVWAPTIRQGIALALEQCRLNGWTVPDGHRWWEIVEG